MGHGVKLTEQQWNELDRVRFTTPSADVFRNCLIILLSNSRKTIASIARDDDVGVRLLDLVGGSVGGPLGQDHRHRFSDDQIRRLLRQQGFSFHRPKHTLKGKRDERAYEKARKKLIRLKKKP